MAYIIQYDDGAFNFGPEGSPANGFPCQRADASTHSTWQVAAAKLEDLLDAEGKGARIIEASSAPLECVPLG